MAKVLVVGDLHLPALHLNYYEFIKQLKRKYKTDTTVFIGDIVDHHAISFHQKHPESDSAMAEHKAVLDSLKKWKRLFPEAYVCIGNHDERIHRLNADVGIPAVYLRDYNQVWDTPKWEWDRVFNIDDVVYTHGTGTSGLTPAFNHARVTGASWVMGHAHSVAGIQFLRAPNDNVIFGMNVGCGVDSEHIVMNYARNFIKKPVLSAGVVIDGQPHIELMSVST